MQDKLLTAEQLKDAIDSFFLDFYKLYLKQFGREIVINKDIRYSLPGAGADCLMDARSVVDGIISNKRNINLELSDRLSGLRFFLRVIAKDGAFSVRFGIRDNPLNKTIEKTVKSCIKTLTKTYFISYDNPENF